MIDDFRVPQKRPTKKLIEPAEKSKQFANFEESVSDSIPEQRLEQTEQTTLGTENKKSRFKLNVKQNFSGRWKIFAGIGAVIIIIALVATWWFVLKPTDEPVTNEPVTAKKKVVAEEEVIVSPLTGVPVADAAQAKRPVTGVMIENSPDARPQSGIDKAGIVFEAIAEGGVTRFLALFQESTPDFIGPIRSARPYYVEWARTFDASYAHVGGSPEALALIRSTGVKDLDQFSNGGSYRRVSARFAPHNVYTDFTKLDALNTKKGYTTSQFTPWERKSDVKQTPTANTIELTVSGPTYSPKFVYEPTTNSYKRFQAGGPHMVVGQDFKTKVQISPKVVIALVMPYGVKSDGYHSDYKTIGTGKMLVFQDGIVSVGKWSKTNEKSQFVFTDKNGLPMKLNAGQTWVTIVGQESAINYKP